MADKNLEPAAFIFPLPDHLKDQYTKWSHSFQQPLDTEKVQGEQGYTPVFIPVYPAYPGAMPYPPFNTGSPSVAGPGSGRALWPLGINPFILFLILILLVIIFRKDQIVATIRDFILKSEPKPEKK